jgi:hypothetical protein
MLSAAHERTLTEVHLFVGSDEGRRVVATALSRRRLPGFFDVEIEEAVLGEALRFLRGGGEIVSVPGWCRARVHARAIDLARGVLRRERVLGVRVPFDDVADVDGSADDLGPDATDAAGDQGGDVAGVRDLMGDDAGSASATGDGSLDEVRARLLAVDAPDEAIAGALTFVSRVADGVTPVEECPLPRAGADEEESAIWVALWYLGVRDCFGPGNAMAKRRSRAAKRIRGVLRSLGGGR